VNADALKAIFPNASPAFIRRNSRNSRETLVLDHHSGSPAELERHLGDGAMGEVQVQKGIGGRVLVRVTAYRRRLLDEDNLCEKYLVDLCRYCGALPSDAAGKAKIEVCQQKVGSNEPEETVIEIFQTD
jgi:hypothetical protein